MKRVAVVGGGIVGVATAHTLQQRGLQVTVFEKEDRLAAHQTGRNSGVIHSGIYYPPGSLKARTCLRGRALLEAFCDRHAIAWKRCGKVIVATQPSQVEKLRDLGRRGEEHGLQVRWLDQPGLRQIEPACAGLEAIFVPETGVVDYVRVVEKLAETLEVRLKTPWVDTGEFDAWINCAGLYCDKLADSEIKIVPFRGEYYALKSAARELCKTLIYPVPDPRFPFLGVHLTRHVDDTVGAGPNAVLALGRENYDGWSLHVGEALETLTYPGFQRLALKYWRMGLWEQLRSLSKWLFLKELQKLTPELRSHHLEKSKAGIRAQCVRPDGRLLDDFLIYRQGRAVHVLNAPSPAATASLAIAEEIADVLFQ
ncbi:MAG: L-2-hydroxyglutarate oxidase [Candidatus Eremiobacteraeota bacterium]|nr:L-2-hydroxyglutarate oxidase [Candidatus Eremiobacteraeota bacterium]MCW5867186.1 L-2-hydroxyglutarate oxidase [Candidatus Eremiobacteraeota bacterium]